METDRLGWIESEAFALLGWDAPDLPVISELAGRMGECRLVVGWHLSTRCQKGTRLEDADNLGEFEERGRENLSLDEGETMTAPAVEDVPRSTGASYFSK